MNNDPVIFQLLFLCGVGFGIISVFAEQVFSRWKKENSTAKGQKPSELTNALDFYVLKVYEAKNRLRQIDSCDSSSPTAQAAASAIRELSQSVSDKIYRMLMEDCDRKSQKDEFVKAAFEACAEGISAALLNYASDERADYGCHCFIETKKPAKEMLGLTIYHIVIAMSRLGWVARTACVKTNNIGVPCFRLDDGYLSIEFWLQDDYREWLASVHPDFPTFPQKD